MHYPKAAKDQIGTGVAAIRKMKAASNDGDRQVVGATMGHVRSFFKKYKELHTINPDKTGKFLRSAMARYDVNEQDIKRAKKTIDNASQAVKDAAPKKVCRKKWGELRYLALLVYGNTCVCCGNNPPTVVITVDHILPKAQYPDKALDIRNLQPMCEGCNQAKADTDMTDWRTPQQKLDGITAYYFPDAFGSVA